MASTRLPGKPLLDICGKPMIQWVYERAARADGVSRVVVATCDREVMEAVHAFGGEAALTSDAHRSGTDRIAEVAAGLDAELVVNVQGDEPLVDPTAISRAIDALAQGGCVMSSLMTPISQEAAADPNLVKVVVSLDGRALYFSRSAIPYQRGQESGARWYGHIGIYAYAREFLLRYSSMEPTPLERTESLEQLRVIENGYHIRMVEVDDRPLGVDTPEDLERVRKALSV